MRLKIYEKEFKASILLAFPRAGRMLRVETTGSHRDYQCNGCQGWERHIATDAAGYPTSLRARRASYEHMQLHEKPRMFFYAMTKTEKRRWLAKKLGSKTPPRGTTLEELQAMVRLVVSKGR